MKQLSFLNGAGRPAIIVPVQASEPDEIVRHCWDIAGTGLVDVVEWRIDPFITRISGNGSAAGAGGSEARELAEAVLGVVPDVAAAGLPVLITLRTGFEGGAAEVGEDDYAQFLSVFITGLRNRGATQTATGDSGQTATGGSGQGQGTEARLALDVEIDRRGASELIALAHEYGLPVVASHHDFADTASAETLLAKFTAMAGADADVAKIAMMPRSRADVARLLRATAEADQTLETPVIGISMGRLGRTSRIMGADFGSRASFAQLGEPSAPGQIAVADLAGMFDRLYG
ncbi:type I 3-dehydroquinate dehydratase [Brevibacterium marinum]|uniref:3-dehydroquinate dehydratase n=1 Tax=Brevibacterium marinum TaxID=418643 RepID=A0A846RV58_9MICO|nr:type I 3-dehydroquinate dehydratase [Brevibacterium marinum]NJC55856.1 3-dehydroquinate dehydratase-1 [Brevibacterium marinum]